MLNLFKSSIKLIILPCREFQLSLTSNSNQSPPTPGAQSGFSLIELIIVILIIMIMTSVALFPFIAHKNAYRTEDQALRVMDFMRQASMRAVSQRQIMRFEIDSTDKAMRIIDEETPESGTTDPHTNDKEVFKEFLDDTGVALINRRPNNIIVDPVISAAVNLSQINYVPSNHPLSYEHLVWTVRFRPDGSVTDAGDVPVNACVYIYTPQTDSALDTSSPGTVRAVTLIGATSQPEYWGFNGTAFQAF